MRTINNTWPLCLASVLLAAPFPLRAQTGAPEIQPTWESIRQHYQYPEWFRQDKFGIFIHWGLYSVAAHHNEWYVAHMYAGGADTAWHIERFGPLDQFGYKDFIPLWHAEKFNPDEWAELFQRSGARYVVPTAEHHDGFALWDSALTKWDAKDMGPKRDLIGDLAAAVRKRGLRFGLSNHRIEHYSFIRPGANLKTDLNDPRYSEFYWTANHSDALYRKFLDDWLARNFELIDKYQPDLLYFDNGVNGRDLDPVKLKVAAYYYNRAAAWKKQVSLSTKDAAYLAGTIHAILFAWPADDQAVITSFAACVHRRSDSSRFADASLRHPLFASCTQYETKL